jgi:hypothetical protein
MAKIDDTVGQESEQQEPEKEDASAHNCGQDHGQHAPVREIGGPKGLEPTRYGDWERKGRCIDF